MNNIVIRFARPEDEDRVAEIAVAQWKAVYDGYREQMGDELYEIYFKRGTDAKDEDVRKNVRDTGHCIVTEIDGVIAGFATFYTDTTPTGEKVGILGNNAVDTDFRGKGIAGRQYEYIFDILRSEGCVAVKVQTGLDDAHAPARRAYAKAGFEKCLPNVVYYKKL